MHIPTQLKFIVSRKGLFSWPRWHPQPFGKHAVSLPPLVNGFSSESEIHTIHTKQIPKRASIANYLIFQHNLQPKSSIINDQCLHSSARQSLSLAHPSLLSSNCTAKKTMSAQWWTCHFMAAKDLDLQPEAFHERSHIAKLAEPLFHWDEPPSRLDPAESDHVFWGAIRSPEKILWILKTFKNSQTFRKIQANQTTTQ